MLLFLYKELFLVIEPLQNILLLYTYDLFTYCKEKNIYILFFL
jgi:hypothetical protein